MGSLLRNKSVCGTGGRHECMTHRLCLSECFVKQGHDAVQFGGITDAFS